MWWMRQREKLQNWRVLLEMSETDGVRNLDSDKQFVYLKRQVEQDVADKIVALNIPVLKRAKNTSASTLKAK